MESSVEQYFRKLIILGFDISRACLSDEPRRSSSLSDCGVGMDRKIAKSIDEYIERFPKETQQLLQKMRLTIRKAAPEAKESISYGMPTFKLGRNRVHFAGYKNHIGFYSIPYGVEAIEKELSKYKQGRGSVQFPIKDPLPINLIIRVVKVRMKQIATKKE
jgi:uncharacterized protein YdhG (YjbR/CyaY superfamily)